jgi:small subunit ribosomal protein S8
MIDPITDMLNQIRNAAAVQKAEVLIPLSKAKYEIASILLRENLISEAKKTTKGKIKLIKIGLKYDNGVSAISGLKRVSKQGQRIYAGAKELKQVKGGYGISIVTTSKGLMTNKEARKNKLGGEVICEVW